MIEGYQPYPYPDKFQEKCAVAAIAGQTPNAAALVVESLKALQNRGEHSSGVASTDGDTIYYHKALGRVADVHSPESTTRLIGTVAIGQNRYPTSRGGDPGHTQPFVDYKRQLAFAHNGNLPDVNKLFEFVDNNAKGNPYYLNDSGLMHAAINIYKQRGATLPEAVQASYHLFNGAFSAIAMDTDHLVAFRDRNGIRPFAIGASTGAHHFASETTGLDRNHAIYIGDVKPGEMVVTGKDGFKRYQIEAGDEHLDLFELIYFANNQSILKGRTVAEHRKAFGQQLALEQPVDADIIVPVMSSAEMSAIGYSDVSGIPLVYGLKKEKEIRSFIQGSQAARRSVVEKKHSALPELVAGQRVCVIEDSIVRGTNMPIIVEKLRQAGAKSVDVRIASAPVKGIDPFGIDLATLDELIANRMTIDQIRDHIGAKSLGYLSYEGMIAATGRSAQEFTTHQFIRKYPKGFEQYNAVPIYIAV